LWSILWRRELKYPPLLVGGSGEGGSFEGDPDGDDDNPGALEFSGLPCGSLVSFVLTVEEERRFFSRLPEIVMWLIVIFIRFLRRGEEQSDERKGASDASAKRVVSYVGGRYAAVASLQPSVLRSVPHLQSSLHGTSSSRFPIFPPQNPPFKPILSRKDFLTFKFVRVKEPDHMERFNVVVDKSERKASETKSERVKSGEKRSATS